MHLELLSVSSADILPASEMSAFLRVDDQTQFPEIQRLVKAAMSKFQEWTGRQLLTASYKMTLQRFCRSSPNRSSIPSIRIPKPPTISITSVGYYAEAGVLTAMTADQYQVVKGEQFHTIIPPACTAWPITVPGLANAVEIVFQCGYGIARESFDEDLIHSLKVLAAHWYESRETGDLPEFVLNLWSQWHTGEQG